MIELGMQFQAMASPCELRLVGADESTLRDAGMAAIDEVRRIERKYSRYLDDSVVSRINRAAGSAMPMLVDDETASLLDFAAQLHMLTAGRFDITSGVLRRAWDFRVPRLPTQQEIDALLPLVGWQQVRWHERRITLPRAGMELDFGGFGKEYAADRAAVVLQHHGLSGGYVNLGGDIHVIGPRIDGSPWRLGIQHPRRVDALLGHVDLHTGALATSGDYERFIELDGRRWCHLLDPRSGWPVPAWQSLSIVAPSCTAAGALCTGALLLGDEGLAFLDEQRVPFVAVTREGQVIDRAQRS